MRTADSGSSLASRKGQRKSQTRQWKYDSGSSNVKEEYGCALVLFWLFYLLAESKCERSTVLTGRQ